jgi:hypothetical protein
VISRAPIARSLAVLVAIVALAQPRGPTSPSMATRSAPAGRTGPGAASPATSPARRRCTPVRSRSAWTYTGSWSGLQIGRNDAIDISGYDRLRCWVHGGSTGGQTVQIEIGNHASGAKVDLDIVRSPTPGRATTFPSTPSAPRR